MWVNKKYIYCTEVYLVEYSILYMYLRGSTFGEIYMYLAHYVRVTVGDWSLMLCLHDIFWALICSLFVDAAHALWASFCFSLKLTRQFADHKSIYLNLLWKINLSWNTTVLQLYQRSLLTQANHSRFYTIYRTSGVPCGFVCQTFMLL